MKRLILAAATLLLVAVPAHALLPLLGCTLTTTGTTCTRGSTTTVRSLPLIGSGALVSTTLDGNLGLALVLNSGTYTAQIECQPRSGDPWLPVAGQTCSASCVIPVLPTCNDVRVNVTACSTCNVSVYVLKDQ
jgi:hypothetical protein